jgi:hypothetical protein
MWLWSLQQSALMCMPFKFILLPTAAGALVAGHAGPDVIVGLCLSTDRACGHIASRSRTSRADLPNSMASCQSKTPIKY